MFNDIFFASFFLRFRSISCNSDRDVINCLKAGLAIHKGKSFSIGRKTKRTQQQLDDDDEDDDDEEEDELLMGEASQVRRGLDSREKSFQLNYFRG